MQQMLDAVRATGATNVVLTSTNSYAGALYDWLQYKPTDPPNSSPPCGMLTPRRSRT
jgi:endoglucanase